MNLIKLFLLHQHHILLNILDMLTSTKFYHGEWTCLELIIQIRSVHIHNDLKNRVCIRVFEAWAKLAQEW